MFFSPPAKGSPKCYAHMLGGCSSKISGEHIFTEAVMGKGGSLGRSGFAFIPDGTFVGMASATANILCTEHNSRLASLDGEAKKLSDALDQFHAEKMGAWQVAIDGCRIERWLLKVCMGYLAAGHTSLGRQFPSGPQVLEALFGSLPMEPPIGMYAMVGVDRHATYTKEVLFRELTAIDPEGASHVVGAFVALHGFPFLFSFGGPFPVENYLRRPDGTSYLDPYDCTRATVKFHPTQLTLRNEGEKRLDVCFVWPE